MTTSTVLSVRTRRRRLALVAALALPLGLTPSGADAAANDKRVATEFSFEGTIDKVHHKNGTCRLHVHLDHVEGSTRSGHTYQGDGDARVQYRCDVVPDTGTAVTGRARAIARVAPRPGTGTQPYRATITPNDVHDVELEVASHAGSNPDGFMATLEIASSASGTPDG